MKVAKTVMIDAPCPLCHRVDTPGPYECSRCKLDVCEACYEIFDRLGYSSRSGVVCKPCVGVLQAEAVVRGLQASEDKPKEEQQNKYAADAELKMKSAWIDVVKPARYRDL